MPRATCRCGQELPVPTDGSERVVCPKCHARVRIRAVSPPADDGFIRFFCPCGRRLKVEAARPPSHGRCPDCGEVVPVPPPGSAASAEAIPTGPEARTGDISPEDLARLEQWSQSHEQKRALAASASRTPPPRSPTASEISRQEAGLRLCPNCRKPVHMGAVACRHCGTHVPKR